MNTGKKHRGTIVPMITPVTLSGTLDKDGVRRVVEFLLQSGVEGIFVLGTTGEAASVPRASRLQLVELALSYVNGRALLYAGLNDNSLAEAAEQGNQYLKAGIDAVVCLLPSYFPIQANEMLGYFQQLLDRLAGPAILYNIPSTTHLSLPIDVIEKLANHPRLVGLKDSENDGTRLRELVRKLGGRANFSVLIGVGGLMAEMLLLGADGIVPSVGNLAPALCHELCEKARLGDRMKVEQLQRQIMEVSALYQNGRTLGQSLAALKTAMSFHGLCEPAVLPPLLALNQKASADLRQQMLHMGILKGQ